MHGSQVCQVLRDPHPGVIHSHLPWTGSRLLCALDRCGTGDRTRHHGPVHSGDAAASFYFIEPLHQRLVASYHSYAGLISGDDPVLMFHSAALQFGGYYVNAGNVPRALRWIPSVSLIKHAFEGLCDNEFPGLEFEPVSADGAGDILKGEQVR